MARPPAPGSETRPRYPWWIGLAAGVGSALLHLLVLTLRVRIGTGGEHLDRLAASDRPVIFAFWHERLAVCGEWISLRLMSERRPVALLTSLSRDGEIAARMGQMRGYRIIRGSTSRGGLASLLEIRRAMRHEGHSAAIAPDGPRGPGRKVQRGTPMLARLVGAPIVPLAYATSRSWRLRSWDRLVVPKPFSRTVLTVGEPIEVPPDLSGDELEVVATDLERRLDELVARAEELLRSG